MRAMDLVKGSFLVHEESKEVFPSHGASGMALSAAMMVVHRQVGNGRVTLIWHLVTRAARSLPRATSSVAGQRSI
jgi:hypothetical protein